MSLNRCTIGDSLVGINAVIELLASKILLKQLADTGNARAAAHHDNFMNILLRKLGIAQESIQRSHCPAEYALAQALELCTSNSGIEVITFSEAVYLYRRLRRRGERTLRLLTCRAKTTKSLRISTYIDPCLLLELLYTVIYKKVVEVLAAKVRITRSGLHFEYTVIEGQDAQIVSTAATIKNQNILLALLANLIETIGECRCRRLIDDAENIETGNDTSILCRLTLGVIEIRRYRDNRMLHLLS